MGDDGIFDDPALWTQRAFMLLRRESDLRWRTTLVFVFALVLLPAISVAEGGLGTAQLLGGLGWGAFSGFLFALITVDNRMETIFPEYGDDAEEEDADDSLRAQYVRGEIDHETFKRRLDEKLGAPADSHRPPRADPESVTQTASTGENQPDPVRVLQTRYANGEIDEREYKERLATIRETDEETAETELSERN